MMRRNTFFIAQAFLVCLFVCYQDSQLSKIVGEIGRCPVLLLVPFFLINEILFSGRKHSTTFKKLNKLFVYFILLYYLASVINIFDWFLLKQKPLVVLGQNIILKTIKVSFYYLLFLLLFRSAFFLIAYTPVSKYLGKIFIFLIILHIVVIVIELFAMPTAFKFLHDNNILYERVRMLAYESSWTGSIAIFLFLGGYYFTNKKKHWIVFSFLLFFLITTGSKQFLIVFPLSILISLMFTRNLFNVFSIAGLVVFVLGITYFIVPFLVESFTKDIEETTSTITRTSTFVTSFTIFFNHLLGTGGLYFIQIAQNISKNASMLTDFLGFGITVEVDTWGIGTDEFITAGSTFAEWLLFAGIPGGYLFLKMVGLLLKISKKHFWLLVAILHFTITNTFSETMVTRLTWPIVFALIIYLSEKLPNAKKNISSSIGVSVS